MDDGSSYILEHCLITHSKDIFETEISHYRLKCNYGLFKKKIETKAYKINKFNLLHAYLIIKAYYCITTMIVLPSVEVVRKVCSYKTVNLDMFMCESRHVYDPCEFVNVIKQPISHESVCHL